MKQLFKTISLAIACVLLSAGTVLAQANCQGVSSWLSTQAYNGGNQVVQNNTLYQANWWTQNQSPATHSGAAGSGQPWTTLGTCGDPVAPTVTITSVIDEQEHYLKASENPTIDIEVDVNDEETTIDSVKFIVVNLMCHFAGCAEVDRYTFTDAPYTLTLPINYKAIYTEIYAIAFSNGQASDAGYKVTNYFSALPEALSITLPQQVNEAKDVFVDASTGEQVQSTITLNTDLIDIDSVEIYVIDVTPPHGFSERKFTIYNPAASFDFAFDPQFERFYTRIVVVPYGDGGKTAGALYNQFQVLAVPELTITSPANEATLYLKSDETVTVTVDVNDEESDIDSVRFILVEVVCNGPGCANVTRETVVTAPFDFTFAQDFDAVYTEVNAIPFSRGIGPNGPGARIELNIERAPEVNFTFPAEGEIITKFGDEGIDVLVDVQDPQNNVLSVSYHVVDPFGAFNYHTLYAPYSMEYNLRAEGTVTMEIDLWDVDGNIVDTDQRSFVVVHDQGCSAQAWDATTSYNTGAVVSHNGNEYRAKWWTLNEEPGTTGQWGVWEDLGACGSAQATSPVVSVFPVPFSSELNIEAAGYDTYVITDSFGSQKATGSLNNGNASVETSSWAGGIYNVILTGANGTEELQVGK